MSSYLKAFNYLLIIVCFIMSLSAVNNLAAQELSDQVDGEIELSNDEGFSDNTDESAVRIQIMGLDELQQALYDLMNILSGEEEEIASPQEEQEMSVIFRDPDPDRKINEKRSTPHAAISNFMKSCQDGNFSEASTYLNFGQFSDDVAENVKESGIYARQLYLVMRYVKDIDLSSFSNQDRGSLEQKYDEFDGEPEDFQPIEILIEAHEMEERGLSKPDGYEKSFLSIALVRSDGEDGYTKGEWLFSQYTVRDVEYWYEQIGYGILGKVLPAFMFDVEFLNIQLWQYILLLIIIFISLLVNKIFKYMINKQLKALEKAKKIKNAKKLLKSVSGPLGFLIMSGFYAIILRYMLLPAEVNRVLISVITGMATFASVWLLYKLVDFLEEYMQMAASKTESTLDDQLVPLVRKSLKVFIVILGVLFILQNFDVDVWGFMAGLGLGGLAFAFAAKDTISNFFGSLMIFVDKPFQVGSWAKINDIEGIVEEIGFRTTRIRTFSNTLVTIPNSILTTSAVEHVSARSRQRIYGFVSIQYGTSADDIKWLVNQINELIKSNDKFYQDYYQTWFSEMGDYALKIMLYCFVHSTDWAVFLEQRQWLFLEIMKKCEEKGIKLAFPTQTLHIDSMPR